jgi:pimeloyl-ACP methyl ester carboxylesterase
MMKRPKLRVSAAELRGYAQLATTATLGVTNIVEAMHHTIAAPWTLFSKKPTRKMGGVPGLVYSAIRGSTRAAGGSAEVLLRALQKAFPPNASSPAHSLAFVSALNGVVGDHLATTGNPLAIEMQWRAGAGFTPTGAKLLVLIHGLCMNDEQWLHDGHDHGPALAKQMGATLVYIRYNSGRPIAHNGAAFAELMESLRKQWPVPLKEITIVGHSMGGLVTRSACAEAERAGHAWRSALKNIIFLGTPHGGAPLERGGHWIDLLLAAIPYSAPFARLTTVRSAGITDLRSGEQNATLPAGVRCFAIAASLGKTKGNALEKIAGDGLVPVASALGGGAISFPRARTLIVQDAGHLDLLSSNEVSEKMVAWLKPARSARVKKTT